MGSAFAPQLLRHIRRCGIERVDCAKRSSEFQLLFGDVDRRHLRAKCSSELHREVPQATHAENRQPLPGHDTWRFSARDRP